MDGQIRQMLWWRSWLGISDLGFLALTALFLSVTYPGYLTIALPYLGLLACPLMYLVMYSSMTDKKSSCDKPGNEK